MNAKPVHSETSAKLVQAVIVRDRLLAENERLRAFVQRYVEMFGAKHEDEVDSPMVKLARVALGVQS